MRRAESCCAKAETLAASSVSCASSFINRKALSINSFCASTSFTNTAACLLTSAMALCVWWSSATLGDGTKMLGLPNRQSSEMLLAPARETTKSAMAYTKSMRATKSVTIKPLPAYGSAALRHSSM